MTRSGEREVQRIEHANGGAGHLLKELLITGEEQGDACKMFARVTLERECELGYHEHHGDEETYYILQGTGIYSDNGKEIEVTAGDVLFCKEGDGHGLKNTGEEDLTFVALILRK